MKKRDKRTPKKFTGEKRKIDETDMKYLKELESIVENAHKNKMLSEYDFFVMKKGTICIVKRDGHTEESMKN